MSDPNPDQTPATAGQIIELTGAFRSLTAGLSAFLDVVAAQTDAVIAQTDVNRETARSTDILGQSMIRLTHEMTRLADGMAAPERQRSTLHQFVSNGTADHLRPDCDGGD